MLVTYDSGREKESVIENKMRGRVVIGETWLGHRLTSVVPERKTEKESIEASLTEQSLVPIPRHYLM